jgi:hypothetical protein
MAERPLDERVYHLELSPTEMELIYRLVQDYDYAEYNTWARNFLRERETIIRQMEQAEPDTY